MDSSQIRLRWTSHQGTVLSVFDMLLSSETLVDVTLAAEGQYLRAHKIILSACSPYFQEVLSLDLNKNPIIFLKDVKYTELKALVQYMYRGEVNISQDELSSLLAVAQSLKIRGLAEVETSTNNMNSDTLILHDLNKSRTPSKPPGNGHSVSTISQHQQQPVSAPLGFQQVHTQVSVLPPLIPQASSSSVNVNSGPILPPPAKRLRNQHHQAQHGIDVPSVTIQPSSSSSHTVPSQLYDPLQTASSSHYAAQTPEPHSRQSRFVHPVEVEETEPMFQGEDVKVEIEEGLTTGGEVVDVEDDEDNSLSHSSFSDSWKQDEAHGSRSRSGDDGEIPGGSGTGNDPGPSGEGEGVGLEIRKPKSPVLHQCEKCKTVLQHRSSLTRHQMYQCHAAGPRFKCRFCGHATNYRHNLQSHERQLFLLSDDGLREVGLVGVGVVVVIPECMITSVSILIDKFTSAFIVVSFCWGRVVQTRRSRSRVHVHFSLDRARQVYTCIHCGHSIRKNNSGSTSALLSHTRRKHLDKWVAALALAS